MLKEFDNFFGDHAHQLAIFRPNFTQNCEFRFFVKNAKFRDFVRFLSKMNFLCPYVYLFVCMYVCTAFLYFYILIYSASNDCKCVSINSVQFRPVQPTPIPPKISSTPKKPLKNLDRHQNLIDQSLGHAPPLKKYNQNLFITF